MNVGGGTEGVVVEERRVGVVIARVGVRRVGVDVKECVVIGKEVQTALSVTVLS